jgi:hypothetical protein
LTGAVRVLGILIAPIVFILMHFIFYHIVTHLDTDNLGYYGRFHRGVLAVLGGMLAALGGMLAALGGIIGGLLICCGGGEEVSQDIQASPPPYFVSAFSSISFTAHQDHITQYALADNTKVPFRNDEKIV